MSALEDPDNREERVELSDNGDQVTVTLEHAPPKTLLIVEYPNGPRSTEPDSRRPRLLAPADRI